jgi:hypothetical protein
MSHYSIEDFGAALIKTGDLDPVYHAISGAGLDESTAHRLCLAYWCLYHLGAAAKLAEIKQPAKFWATLMDAAVNDGRRWPRGSERRHFRAANAVNAVEYLKGRYKTATDAVFYMLWGGREVSFADVAARVRTHVGFGPWIAFKIADMGERVLGARVDFSNCELGIYKDPRQGGALAFVENLAAKVMDSPPSIDVYKPWEYPISDEQLALTIEHYVKHFSKFKAPPSGDRKVNVQEVETIFCKYKSHRKGHYQLGKDAREVAHGLIGWGDLADQLKTGLPDISKQPQLF